MKKQTIIGVSVLLISAIFLVGQKYFPSAEKKAHFSDNYNYKMQTEYYPLYNKQFDIVMLGNSMISHVKWDEFLNRSDIANRGVGGDVSAGCLARIGSVLNCKPKVCIIECGINDIAQNIPLDQTFKNIKQIIDTLQSHQVKVVLCKVVYVAKSYPKSDEVNKQVTELNRLLSALKVPSIDLNTVLTKDGYLLPEYSLDDGIHLSVKGYRIWAEKLKEIL